MTPAWMPHMPEPWADTVYGWAYTADQMHAYALAAVAAYRKSLKPVAWTEKEQTVGLPTFMSNDAYEYSKQNEAIRTLFCVPLFRLDDQP